MALILFSIMAGTVLYLFAVGLCFLLTIHGCTMYGPIQSDPLFHETPSSVKSILISRRTFLNTLDAFSKWPFHSTRKKIEGRPFFFQFSDLFSNLFFFFFKKKISPVPQ